MELEPKNLRVDPSVKVTRTGGSGEPSSLLRDGRILAGRVLEPDGNGRSLLQLGRERFIADTRVPLEPGQQILVRVEGEGESALLRLLAPGDSSVQRLLGALRGILGDDRSLGQLLGDLAARLRGELARPVELPPDVRALLDSLPRHSLQPADGAQGLSELLTRAGIRYEALLAAAVSRGLGAPDLDRLRTNLKAELLDSLGKLERGPVRDLVTRLLSSLESEQLLNLARRSSGEPLQWSFPYPDGAGWTTARITLPERDPNERQTANGPGAESRFVVEVSFTRLGPIRAELSLAEDRLAIRLRVTSEESAERIRTSAPELVERLQASHGSVSVVVHVAAAESLIAEADAWDVSFLHRNHLVDLEG